MNYIAHVPLAGGFALGNMNITGKPPVAITSYSPFEANDLLLRRYLAKKGFDVPYYQLDKLTEDGKRDLPARPVVQQREQQHRREQQRQAQKRPPLPVRSAISGW